MFALYFIAVLNILATVILIATRRTPRTDRTRMRRTLAYWLREQGK